jgi:hypothetical protein
LLAAGAVIVILADAGEAIIIAYWEEVEPRLEPVVLVSVVSAVSVTPPAMAESRYVEM